MAKIVTSGEPPPPPRSLSSTAKTNISFWNACSQLLLWRHASLVFLAVIVIIAAQICATLFLEWQRYSITVGLVSVIFLCSVITAISKPKNSKEAWRWNLGKFGFMVWGMGFAAIAFQDNFLDSSEFFSSIASIIKQICFIVILVPSADIEDVPIFRVVDSAQSVVFSISLGLLTWSPLKEALNVHGRYSYSITGYIALAALALISYATQQNDACRSLGRNLSILFGLYAFTSAFAIYLHVYYSISDNSIIWVFGDLPFFIYVLMTYLGLRPDHAGISKFSLSKSFNLRHLSPLFIAIIISILAIEIGDSQKWLGMMVGGCGLTIYAIRMALLLEHYVKIRDQKIIAEQLHSRLLIDMVHEIRSPLGSVMLNASMLSQIAGLSTREMGWVDQIGRGGNRVTTMLNDVLDIEKIDAGLVGPVLCKCDPVSVITSAVQMVAAQATASDISINIQNSCRKDAFVDPAMLERIIINLLVNALRFTKLNGEIIIDLKDGESNMIIIRVIDNGIGIPLHIQQTLFDRFSHIGTPLRGQKGSGLGLSICLGLATLMGGKIRIESEPNVGTTAILQFPSAPGIAIHHQTP